MKGSTISDRELGTWSAIKRSDEAHAYNWHQHGWGAPYIVTFLSAETLEMRRILRAFIARHEPTTKDPLVLRAVEILGFNLDPAQPVFPEWPAPEPETEADIQAEAAFFDAVAQRQGSALAAVLRDLPEPPACPHCGRCVLAGPPCCDGMAADIASQHQGGGEK